MDTVILIPAYKPSFKLVSLIKSLAKSRVNKIIVVDDGGGKEYGNIFKEIKKIPKATVLTHEINQGKGAALKTGFRYIYEHKEEFRGVVTADADGQHKEGDILKVASALENHPGALVLGARTFSGKVPWRSSFGNRLTGKIFRIFFGIKISDTQTGLRGIHASMIPLFLDIPFNHYEFEAEMLLVSSRKKIPFFEVPIETVYENNNSSSHFNPLLDSLKIYFVILRYTLSSLLSAFVDFIVFVIVYPLIGNILFSVYAARSVSLCVNYALVSKKVFLTEEKMSRTFPKYLLLVVVSGFLSSVFIYCLHSYASIGVNLAKILSESILYIVNFFIQKRFIFNEKG